MTRRTGGIRAALPGHRLGRAALAALVLAVVVGAVVVLGGDDPAETTAGPGPPRTTTASSTEPPTSSTVPPTTAAPQPAPGLRFLPDEDVEGGTPAPLTGLRVADPAVLARPALAVKVDNLDGPSSDARPQVGLARADVVVEEVVEGGITRFVALLHSTGAAAVGPVRSARTTDVQLLPAFGVPLFAFSGANPGTASTVAASPSLVDLGGEWSPAYHRVGGRRRPHNLMVSPDDLWARGAGGVAPAPLGPFQPLTGPIPAAGQAALGVDLGFRGAAASAVSWRWSGGDGRWVRTQRGSVHVDAEGFAVGPRNVVVLVTEYQRSPADPRSPEAVTVGSGEALVLTRGVVVRGRWERATEAHGFTLTDATGAAIPLTVGRTWIELAPPGTATVAS